jgi:hypothetical protein
VRRLVTTVVIVALAIIASFDDCDARPLAGAASRHTGSSRARTPSRSRATRSRANGPTSAFECDAPRGIDAFGSTDRCLRALCSDANRVNEYVLDAAERLRRNPCAAVDPSDARR